MARTVTKSNTNFERLVEDDCFYIDKTMFIKEWWDSKETVTLITRPRRFGKSLTMNMVERFFSIRYEGNPKPFENLAIGKDPAMMKLQGTMPVIMLTFATVNGDTYERMIHMLSLQIRKVFERFRHETGLRGIGRENAAFVKEILKERYDEKGRILPLAEETILSALPRLSLILKRKYDKEAIIILDEYDTPLQSAYLNGYWRPAAKFFGELFKLSFKENELLGRALITGISRVSKESLFSPFNNPSMCSVTAPFYEDSFGFTQREVDDALAEYGMEDKRDEVKRWYDGYRFGNKEGMYNPLSIVSMLSAKKVASYWANTASNEIVSHVIRNGSSAFTDKFVTLMQGGSVTANVDEETVYMTLLARNDTVWGLLLACGYLKARECDEEGVFTLSIVNHEVRKMMDSLVLGWFRTENDQRSHDDFTKAVADCDEESMQKSLSALSMELIGSSDGSNHEPEKFYHGFVLGIVAALRNRFVITSNRESGKGRSDILMEPRDRQKDKGIVIEFKVFNPKEEKDLEGTCARALDQIEKKQYAQELRRRGSLEDRIVKFGIGYMGKEVLVRKA